MNTVEATMALELDEELLSWPSILPLARSSTRHLLRRAHAVTRARTAARSRPALTRLR